MVFVPKSKCPRCGVARFRLDWQTFRNGDQHIRVECANCGAYVCYAPKTPENLEHVGPPPVGESKKEQRLF